MTTASTNTTTNVHLIKKGTGGRHETVAHNVTRAQAIACLRALREVEGSLDDYDLRSAQTDRPVNWTLAPIRR